MKLALLNQLEQSHWWSPEQIFKQQLRQAGALLLQAYRHVLFYRERLAQVGFLPGKPLTPEIWRRIPVLTRAELQRAGERLYPSEIPSQHSRTYEIFPSALLLEPHPVGIFVILVGSEMEICQILEENLREAEANIRLEGGVISDEDRNLLRDMLRG